MTYYIAIHSELIRYVFDCIEMNQITWAHLVSQNIARESGVPTLSSRQVYLNRNIPVHRVLLKFVGRDVGYFDLTLPEDVSSDTSWVAIKDGMPEIRSYYLSFRPPNVIEICYLNRDGDWVGGNGVRLGITHWMIMPSPPLVLPEVPILPLPKRRVRKN